MRVTAQGHVESGEASRILTQLCNHLARKTAGRPDLRASVELRVDRGAVDFGWARSELRADERRLALRVEADDPESLDTLRSFLAWHLGELGATVSWTDGRMLDPRAGMRSFHRRTRRANEPACDDCTS